MRNLASAGCVLHTVLVHACSPLHHGAQPCCRHTRRRSAVVAQLPRACPRTKWSGATTDGRGTSTNLRAEANTPRLRQRKREVQPRASADDRRATPDGQPDGQAGARAGQQAGVQASQRTQGRESPRQVRKRASKQRLKDSRSRQRACRHACASSPASLPTRPAAGPTQRVCPPAGSGAAPGARGLRLAALRLDFSGSAPWAHLGRTLGAS